MRRAALMLITAAAGVASAVTTIAAEPATPASGEAVYQRWCSHCHSAGRGNPGTDSLKVKYGDRLPAVLLERTDLDAMAVKMFVRQGVLSMPPFRKTEITDTELAALGEYIAKKNARP